MTGVHFFVGWVDSSSVRSSITECLDAISWMTSVQQPPSVELYCFGNICFLPLSFPAFLFSCRRVRMSHSAVSRSCRRDLILLPAPSRPCGHRQTLRYPVPIAHRVLLVLPSFTSSQHLSFFPHRTLRRTARTFTSANLRCPILFLFGNILTFTPYL
jgi:hypothetical protein